MRFVAFICYAILALAVAAAVHSAMRDSDVRLKCQPTGETKTERGVMMVGKVMLPVTYHYSLYSCPDGSQEWVRD